MNPTELDTFLILETDPQREIYITEFWRRRDVANGTTNHSFRDEYYERLETAKEEFKNVSSDRGRIYLIHGEPTERIKIDCRLLQPAEIWKYAFIPGLGHDVRFLFFKPRNGIDFKLFIPIDPDMIKQLISQDEIGMDVTERPPSAASLDRQDRARTSATSRFNAGTATSIMRAVCASAVEQVGSSAHLRAAAGQRRGRAQDPALGRAGQSERAEAHRTKSRCSSRPSRAAAPTPRSRSRFRARSSRARTSTTRSSTASTSPAKC